MQEKLNWIESPKPVWKYTPVYYIAVKLDIKLLPKNGKKNKKFMHQEDFYPSFMVEFMLQLQSRVS